MDVSVGLSHHQENRRRYFAFFLTLILANTLFHLWFIWKGPLDLFPDEAHYWDWSRHPDISYYSKGPIVAYVILLFTSLFGTSAFAVRSGAVVLSVLSGLLIYHLAKTMFRSERVGFYAAAMIFLTPLLNAGTFIMTIDAPFVFFWTVAILAGYKALRDRKEWWYLVGVAAGLGALSKYTMFFIWPSILLHLALSRNDRHWLKRKELYLSFLLCLVFFSPVLIWNAMHGWVSFRHLAGQAKVHEGFRVSLKWFFEFLGSQVGVVTPLFFFAVAYGLWKGARDGIRERRREYLYLFSCGVVMLISYLLKSFQAKAQANWAGAAYVPAAILSVAVLDEKISTAASQRVKSVLRRLSIVAYAFALVAVLVSHSFELLRWAGTRISYKRDPTTRAIGWKELGDKVGDIHREMKSKKETFIFSDRYQVTSELAFYVAGRPQTYNVNLGRRLNQYDFWEGFENLAGQDAIYVYEGDAPLPRTIRRAFERREKERPVRIERFGLLVKTFSIFRCYNFRGLKEETGRTTY